MRILHRITKNVDGEIQRTLHRLGVEVSRGLCTFVVDESHPDWPQIKQLIAPWGPVDFVTTEFTAAERAAAENLVMEPTWHHGYPQPEDDFGYLKKTYDLSENCAECDIGKRQHAPLRMKREPTWGKRQILQLNWVFDEFFVLPEVWDEVFKPMGIASLPVLEHRTGKELRTVVQLEIKDVASPIPGIREYDSAICEVCGQTKYFPITHGFFPAFSLAPSGYISRTQESFGSGGEAFNEIVVTRELYHAIRTHKLSGASFTPISKP